MYLPDLLYDNIHTHSARAVPRGSEPDSASARQQQQLSGIPENQTFGGSPSDGATSSVRRLLAQTELLLRDAQAADERSM